MVNDIRLKRLTEVVKQRVSVAMLQELKDPRIGFITVTGVKLAKDLTSAVVLWSIIGSDGDRSKTAHALEDARGFLQSEVAKVMGTRVTPRLTFHYDPSLAKAQKVFEILARLKEERGDEPPDPAAPPEPSLDDSFEDAPDFDDDDEE